MMCINPRPYPVTKIDLSVFLFGQYLWPNVGKLTKIEYSITSLLDHPNNESTSTNKTNFKSPKKSNQVIVYLNNETTLLIRPF